MERAELTEAMREVLHEYRSIEDETHKAHHEYIQLEMQKRERRADLFQKFKSSFVGGIALAVLGFLGWIGNLIIENLKT